MAAARSPYGSREPTSPVRYANINPNPSYPYPPDTRIDARSFESDSSNDRDSDPDLNAAHKRHVHAYGDGQPRAGFDDARAINRTGTSSDHPTHTAVNALLPTEPHPMHSLYQLPGLTWHSAAPTPSIRLPT